MVLRLPRQFRATSAALIVVLSSILPVASVAQERTVDIAGLSWMSGDWESRTGNHYVEEHWTVPFGGTMVGMGRTIVADKTTFFEYLRIEVRADGLYYVAHPKARPGVDFRMARMTSNEVVFENPGHDDHIKQVIYRKISSNEILARVEGADNGKPFAEDFHYTRMASR